MDQSIYILNEGEKQGPYTAQQLLAEVKNGKLSLSQSAWQHGLQNWVPLSNIIHPCPQCGGELWAVSENPQKGTGSIMIVLGILFAPLCIGIPIFIWGLVLIAQTRSNWHCRSCGRVFPG